MLIYLKLIDYILASYHTNVNIAKERLSIDLIGIVSMFMILIQSAITIVLHSIYGLVSTKWG